MPLGVVADGEAAAHADLAADRDRDRHRADHDRAEVVAEAGRGLQRAGVPADERGVPADEQAEDLAGVVEEREAQARVRRTSSAGRRWYPATGARSIPGDVVGEAGAAFVVAVLL